MNEKFSLLKLGNILQEKYIGIIFKRSLKSATIRLGKLEVALELGIDKNSFHYVDLYAMINKRIDKYERYRNEEDLMEYLLTKCNENSIAANHKKIDLLGTNESKNEIQD